MVKQGRGKSGLARFGEPGLLILTALLDGPKHGYAITADVESTSGVRLGPGTLYGALAKLEQRGLITPLPSEDRRRPYAITDEGRAAVAEQIAMWRRVVHSASMRLRPA